MPETHEVVDFGEPFYSGFLNSPLTPAFRLSTPISGSSCELGESPIYRPEDNTLHYVDLLSASVRRLRVLMAQDRRLITRS